MIQTRQANCPFGPWGPWTSLAPTRLALLLCVAAHLAHAADFPLRWRWSNPLPHGNNIVDMAYSPSRGLAVQVAERGQLYTSTDFGTWLPAVTGTPLALRAVTFFGNRIVVTGESGTVLYADSADAITPGTLVDGPTADWLEAVTASATLAVAVGDNGAVYTSTNGVQWKRQASGTTSWLLGVAHGNNRFVAVGETGRILSSPNGTNWTLRTSGVTTDLNRVAFGANQFIAAGAEGVLLVSPDAVTWQPLRSGATNDLYYAAGAGPDVLAVGDNEVRLMDNLVWSNPLADTNGPPAWVYYAALGRPDPGPIVAPTYFLLGGRTGMLVEGYQGLGQPYQWNPIAPSPRSWLFDVAWATNLFVAVGDRATLLTSSDGVQWSVESVPPTATNSVLLGVGGTTNLLLAAGNQGTLLASPHAWTNLVTTNAGGTVITQQVSTLGLVWHEVLPRLTALDLQGVTFGHSLYLVAGDGGQVFTSPDGTNWTARSLPTTNFLSGAAAFPDGFVVSGEQGTLCYSPDGVSWTNPAPGLTANWLVRVRYCHDRLLAAGLNGTLATSTNGRTWSLLSSGTTELLNDVTWINGAYFAVGTAGTVLASTNALTWTNLGTITAKSLYAATANNYSLITVGVEGVVLRSPIVPDPTPIQFLSYSRTTRTNNLVDEVFLLAGHPDQRFTLDQRAGLDTNSWTAGPPLEFLDASGTLYYLQTSAASNAPPAAYYRATLTP